MKLILTLVGFLAIWTCVKFVFLVFKRLGSKNNMNDLIDRMEDGMANSADRVAGYIRKQKKIKKKRKKEEQPIVTIR